MGYKLMILDIDMVFKPTLYFEDLGDGDYKMYNIESSTCGEIVYRSKDGKKKAFEKLKKEMMNHNLNLIEECVANIDKLKTLEMEDCEIL